MTHRMKKFIAVLAVAAGCAVAAGGALAANLIQNPGFEDNPPPNFGNNIGWSISPWIVGGGSQPNVVKVDGPGGYNYASNGPESDASAPGAGVEQHYLDIANGSNDFYQVFKIEACPAAPDGEMAEVTFGGAFSTRGNSSGKGSITIRSGTGTGGAVLATLPFNLPAGNSKTDPWVVKTGTVSLPRGTTFSFVVQMSNPVNFDNAFLYIEKDPCNPDDGGDQDDPGGGGHDDPGDGGGSHDDQAQCLRLDPKVKCSADGVISVSLNGSGPLGFTPDTLELTSLTSGVTVTPSELSLPGQTFTLNGASEGQTVTLLANAVASGAGKAEGTDLCCASKIEVQIPKDICPRDEPKEPKLTVKKECGPVEKGEAFPFEAQCTITVTGENLPSGSVVEVNEMLSGMGMIGMITSSASSEPWSCSSSSWPASAGTPVNCTLGADDLMAAGGTSVINVTVGWAGPHDAEESRNCASVGAFFPGRQSAKSSVLPDSIEEEKSCHDFSGKPDDDEPLDVKISKAHAPGGAEGPRFFISVEQVSGSLKAGDVVIVTDTVPPNATFTSLNAPSGWSCTPASIPPAMSAGQTLTCSYTVSSDGPLGSVSPLEVGAPPGVAMENCATVEVRRPGELHGLPETDTANNTACDHLQDGSGDTGENAPRLNVDKKCDPAVQGPTGATAQCTITVTGAHLPAGAQVEVKDAIQVYGGQVTAIAGANSADGWTCGQTPVAANQDVTCSISGAALNAASPSVLNVTVSLPANFASDPAHNKNCAMGGIQALGLQSGISCATFTEAQAIKPPVVKPPVVHDPGPKCDARTTVRKGRACACRFGGARKVSPTRCACPRSTKLNPKRGRCEKMVVCKKPAFPTRAGKCACPRGWRPDGRNGCRKIEKPRPNCVKPAFPVNGGRACACPRGWRKISPTRCRKIEKPRPNCVKPAFPVNGGRACACPRGWRQVSATRCRKIEKPRPNCVKPAFPVNGGRACACPRGWRKISPTRCLPRGKPDHPKPGRPVKPIKGKPAKPIKMERGLPGHPGKP